MPLPHDPALLIKGCQKTFKVLQQHSHSTAQQQFSICDSPVSTVVTARWVSEQITSESVAGLECRIGSSWVLALQLYCIDQHAAVRLCQTVMQGPNSPCLCRLPLLPPLLLRTCPAGSH
jgi:hypothetical protein